MSWLARVNAAASSADTRSRGTQVADFPAQDAHLELPRPWRLALSVVVSLAESLGLPAAGYVAGMAISGQNAAMMMATAVVWVIAGVRKVVTGKVPGLLIISALVLTLQAAVVVGTGSQLFFLLQFPLANLALCLLFARTAPTSKPLVARLAAEVVSLRQPIASHAGLQTFFRDATWLWAGVFGALTVGMAVLMVSEPASVFLLLTTAVTIGGVIVGSGLSVMWFLRARRRFGLRVRLAQA
jgi:hypothetical protein